MRIVPTLRTFGGHTILLEWPSRIDEAIHHEVLRHSNYIRVIFQKWLIDVVPTYHSIALYVNPKLEIKEFVAVLRTGLKAVSEEKKPQRHLISLPVCYDEDFGLDLLEMSVMKNLSVEEIIRRHTTPTYTVYFVGFLPGFPYLGGLDPSLEIERKETPRPFIDKGSVGIGGSQTGIYPAASPGGWHIIGRTPLDLFDPTATPPAFITPGDKLKFEKISKDEYELIQVEQESGTFRWRKEVMDD